MNGSGAVAREGEGDSAAMASVPDAWHGGGFVARPSARRWLRCPMLGAAVAACPMLGAAVAACPMLGAEVASLPDARCGGGFVARCSVRQWLGCPTLLTVLTRIEDNWRNVGVESYVLRGELMSRR